MVSNNQSETRWRHEALSQNWDWANTLTIQRREEATKDAVYILTDELEVRKWDVESPIPIQPSEIEAIVKTRLEARLRNYFDYEMVMFALNEEYEIKITL